MKTKNKVLIIAAFPAMGKTYFVEHNSNYTKQIIDPDSSLFSWNYTYKDSDHIGRIRNQNFPINYLNYIAYMYRNLQDYPALEIEGLSSVSGVIFVSTHSEVLKGLKEYGLPFISAVPSSKSVLMERLDIRNDPMAKMIYENYDNFSDSAIRNSDNFIASDLTISELLRKHWIN